METNIGIICACLPVLRTLVSRGLSAVLGSSLSRGTKAHPGSGYELRATDNPSSLSQPLHHLQQKQQKRYRAVRDEYGTALGDGASDEVRMVDCGGDDERSETTNALHEGIARGDSVTDGALDFGLAKPARVVVRDVERGSDDGD